MKVCIILDIDVNESISEDAGRQIEEILCRVFSQMTKNSNIKRIKVGVTP